MVRKILTIMIAALLVCGMVFTISCSKKQVKPDTGATQEKSTVKSSDVDEDAAVRMEMQRAREAFENEDVYFDFDRSDLTADARSVLERKAAWLRSNADESVTVEGHCDERGTAEYNIALGERRAKSAMEFLVDMGIESSRLDTVSYGEEKPVDTGHDEDAWAKNRRAHFVIH
ncbi:MAG: peptidoglycan-associated lipoprotein Pal [Thermodesulfobacteriota bacterium]